MSNESSSASKGPKQPRSHSRTTRNNPLNSLFNSLSDSDSSTMVIEFRKEPIAKAKLVAAEIPPIFDTTEYVRFEEEDRVEKVIREEEGSEEVIYKVRFEDNHTEVVTFEKLIKLPNGQKALNIYNTDPPSQDSEQGEMPVQPRNRKAKSNQNSNFVDITDIEVSSSASSEDELAAEPVTRDKRKQGTLLTLIRNGNDSSRSSRAAARQSARARSESGRSSHTSSETASRRTSGRTTRFSSGLKFLQNKNYQESYNLESEEEESGSSDDDGIPQSILSARKRKRTRATGPGRLSTRTRKIIREGTRRSGRANKTQTNMEEIGVDDIYRSDSEPRVKVAPKATGLKENFQVLPRTNEFRQRHISQCESCGNGSATGQLIYCQGCVSSYHKHCLGPRNSRDHLVTKIAEDDYVLQCRRCINTNQRREPIAPNHAMCQDCHATGSSCVPFRQRKTALQEQREREDNQGEDPVVYVDSDLINNADNVLFRCARCSRAFHFHHLISRAPHQMDLTGDDSELADYRFNEYSTDWTCFDCINAPAKVAGIIAWKPTDEDAYVAGSSCDSIYEDDKAYLIKWENLSYFRATWMPGAWVWGVTASAMRKAFFKKETSPKMRTEDAIPEEYLRIDIVLDVRFTSIVPIRTEDIDKARIKEVDEALIKYKGLGYEDAVWEKVPGPDDGDRWTDFVKAYDDWVLGRYTHCPKSGPLKARVEKARAQPFTKLERKKQPENLVGGELMKYQIDGLNWLYYQWYTKNNGILADEMGLGKTIQVIAFLVTMVQDQNCFPFLVVVPNSTCANWRREIKQWAPSLRVVTYFGSSQARTMAYQHEMYPEGAKDLRCHVVVTSYDAVADDSSRKFFRGVPWVGLIVDEGQRLKNDKSLLYGALNDLRIPFRVLLTGTPLQNNARELFNLLQFLSDDVDAAALEEEYSEMTAENITKLHDLIRPFILRRTKAQVLTFLPSMAQIIVPLTMSTLQKELYKSILAKSPELLRALFAANRGLKSNEKGNLSNILMQLRKCLCHPFVYSREIEERTDVLATSHRNLVDASTKLQLLEVLLPKLKERGHRVLLFSQFLDMLDIVEDFLDGLEMRCQRLDGTITSLEKQKRIDEYNAPDSPLFAFLLSTRAGGVGINLATADTVIILDPDFNPHQDIQALSRAHRIGQKKKVLCFQLMTRSSVEEKIVQIGRKKMALDHVVVESLEADDLEEQDLESVLKHGAAELFQDGGEEKDILYDSLSVDKLLDRSQIENTKSGDDNSAESQFSFARVWANDDSKLQDTLEIQEKAPDPSMWDAILKERAQKAAAEAAAREQALGRGKRARLAVDYAIEGEIVHDTVNDVTDKAINDTARDVFVPEKLHRARQRKVRRDSDTDFLDEESQEESEGEPQSVEENEFKDLRPEPEKEQVPKLKTSGKRAPSMYNNPRVKPYRRARSPAFKTFEYTPDTRQRLHAPCRACGHPHATGACPLKVSGVEHCGLCGLAHFGHQRSCPHINSETQVIQMIQALKHSPEPRHMVESAVKYLRGVKGTLVQKKKRDAEKASGVSLHGEGAKENTVPVEERLTLALAKGGFSGAS
ncbi:hypothetical protein M501DRAFT_991062 [Patellaria atrata CBS 101060]|uniref:Uncharacterized protein n=1 Tax=Patellaria atrata CBS 101060 TaxID=1346257 RepID=A0A9P4SCE6_9PEZI|nr:hypothetical protein M501DRAFT_991062 [Patellaria atrata CBS 101060]